MKQAKHYIGMDVHKEFTHYAVKDRDGHVVFEGRCSSIGKELYDVLSPYLSGCKICMECNTEVYGIYDFFREKGITIAVANVTQLRCLIGKNDELDALRLSDMLRLGTLPEAYIPCGDIRQLRSLIVLRHSTMHQLVAVKNQVQSIIRKHGLRMPVTWKFTKKWISRLHQYTFEKNIPALRHALEIHDSTNKKLEQLDIEIVAYAKANFKKEHDALVAKSGIGDVLATYFIAEICPIKRFASKKKLRRYAGVIPCSQKSADKTYSTFLPKTTSRERLRWALIQTAHCMIHHCSSIRNYYLKKKKQKKIANKAVMAVASSISDIIFMTLKNC